MRNVRRILGLSVVFAAVPALVSCHGTEATYSIGGGLSGSTVPVVLKLNGGNDISMSGDGSFKFDKKLLKDDTFNVQIVDSNDRCTVANGAGTVGKSNITDVAITCSVQTQPIVPQLIIRSAILTGAAESPTAVETSASGVGGVIANSNTLDITGGVTLSGLTAINSVGLFQAPLGNAAGNGSHLIDLILAADGVTAVLPAGSTLANLGTTANQLLGGALYFEVRTVAHPNGEIRGQIEVQGGVAASAANLDQAQVVPPTGSPATGTGMLIADLATRRILISYITHTVVGASAADIHTSNGVASPIVVFTNVQNLATPPAGTTMTAQNLTDFNNNFLYFNVNGEIRGNISPQ
jgi:hypothetical protein